MTYIQNNLRPEVLKTCNFTYNYQSTLMETPESLPTSEPANPQVSYNITEGMFPILTGDLPQSINYVGFLLAGCINNNGSSSRTLNWRVKRNGTSIGNGAQLVAASNKGTLNFDSLSGTNKPVTNDVLGIYLWCTESNSDMQLNRYGLGIIPVRIKPINDSDKLLMHTGFTVSTTGVSNFTVNYSGSYFQNYKWFNNDSGNLFATSGVTTITGTLFDSEHPTYGILTNNMDTAPGNYVLVNGTSYCQNPVYRITTISWRETNIKYLGN